MTKKYDYLIIGQGIAGSAFAWNLYLNDKSFLIIDSKEKNTASEAALGIYNPITGRRNSLTWNADKLFDTTEDFYLKIGNILGKKIISNMNEGKFGSDEIVNSLLKNHVFDPIKKKKINI